MDENESSVVSDKKWYVFEVIKAVIISLIFSLVFVLVAAFAIKFFNIPVEAVPIINQVIRSLSILLGCLIALRKPAHGWLRGIISGLLYSAIAFVLFSLMGDGFTWDLSLLNNTVVGMAAGLISGIMAMVIRRN